MTSNIGARKITENKKMGFLVNDNNQENEYEIIKKDVMAELKNELKPEFINRIDDIVIFHKLTPKEINIIVDLFFKKVNYKLESQGYFIEFDETIKKLIVDKCISSNYGARPIRRMVQTVIEDNLAEAILDSVIYKEQKILMFIKDKKIGFRKISSSSVAQTYY